MRTTAAATAVVAVALLAAAGGLVVTVERTLTGRVRAAAHERVEVAAGQLAAGKPLTTVIAPRPDQLPAPVLLQVVDERGVVIYESAPFEAVEAPVVVTPAPRGAGPDAIFVQAPNDVAVASRRVPTSDGSVTVLAISPLAEVTQAVDTVINALQVGIPVLVLLVALIAWVSVGRALRPIEAMRAEAEAISGSTLHRRVPEPPTTDEVGRLAHTLNRMLGRLDEAVQRQRRFVSDASHELRSPIATLRTEAEVARVHPPVADWKSMVDTVVAETGRLEALVDDLLTLARLDEDAAPAVAAPIDLDALVDDEVARIRDVQVERTGSAGTVSGAHGELARMVANLLANAARHAERLVAVRMQREGGQAVLAIEDDGPGVPEPERDRIFERFARLDEGRSRAGGGSGLGLAIVRDIAARHGATVTVGDSRLGGARFEVRLPAAAEGSG